MQPHAIFLHPFRQKSQSQIAHMRDWNTKVAKHRKSYIAVTDCKSPTWESRRWLLNCCSIATHTLSYKHNLLSSFPHPLLPSRKLLCKLSLTQKGKTARGCGGDTNSTITGLVNGKSNNQNNNNINEAKPKILIFWKPRRVWYNKFSYIK